MGDAKAVLHEYLRRVREDLLEKLEGLSEHEARLPRTGTGNNLLGLVKHCLNVEAGYFGPTFGRRFPDSGALVPFEAYESDPHADWYATPDESLDGLVQLYRRVAAFADETIEQRPADEPGSVPWWQEGRRDVTLQQVLVHVLVDLSRHAGHADVLRESYDGAVGLRRQNTNVPDDIDWPGHVAKLTRLADRFR